MQLKYKNMDRRVFELKMQGDKLSSGVITEQKLPLLEPSGNYDWCLVCVCVLMSQGLGGSWRDPGEGLQAAASAGQQQGETGHRSGWQTEARRHQSGLIKHVSGQ